MSTEAPSDAVDPSVHRAQIDNRPATMDAVEQVSLPPAVAEFVSRYEDLIGGRDAFLWKWIHDLFPAFELSSVPGVEQEEVRTEKTILTIFVTVLDDLVEDRGDFATFAEARFIPFDAARVRHDRDDVDGEIIGYLMDLWMELDSRLRDAPRYAEFEDLFEYDLRQTMNSIRYDGVTTEHLGASNETGYFQYASHNMCMFSYSDIDAMHSPDLFKADIGSVRSVLWDLQELARIGNDVSTWEREIDEHDFCSAVVVRALEADVLTPEELQAEIDEESVKARIRQAGIESEFMAQWTEQFERVQRDVEQISAESVDIEALVEGMRTVFEYHLESRGRK